MGLPWSAGAAQVRSIFPPPVSVGVATTWVGAAGTAKVVTWAGGDEAGPVPTALVAFTVTL